ncbi:MAG: SH3 domain-containing protein [Anaerolineae bacterium]|nr:SH3 domain-containing protein [Anaerolineae bacterium]
MTDLERQLETMREELNRLRQIPDESRLREMEQEGQDLLRQTAGSALNAQAETLFKEILTIRRSTVTPSPQITDTAAELDALLRRARVRVKTASDPAEYRGALSFVHQVLDLDAETPEAYDLLEKLIGRAPDLQETAITLLTPLAARSSRAREVLQRLSAPSPEGGGPSGAPRHPDISPPPPQPPGPRIFDGGATLPTDLDELRRRMTDLYYQGEYREAINLCNKILGISPNDEQAKDYRIKAEDYLNRGFVPDIRIPLQARMAYNRGNSAKRAGMYKEAQDLYNEALHLARMEGLDRWADAENALMEIEDLVLAKKLTEEGDALAKQDRWDEAAQKYEGALELSESPRTRKKYDMLNKVLLSYRQIDVRLDTLSGSLIDMASQLTTMRQNLSEAREYWSDSAKLGELWAKVEGRSRDIASRLEERGRMLLNQASDAPTLADRLRLLDEALKYLEAAGNLQAEDAQVSSSLQTVLSEQDRANSVKRLLDEAEKSLNLRDDQGAEEALVKLQAIAEDYSDYAQDPRFRSLLSKLQRNFLDQADRDLEEGAVDLNTVRARLEKLRGKPFNLLGRTPAEVRSLYARIDEIQKARRRKQLQPFILGGLGLIAFLILILATRGIWDPIINPPPTPTPTITSTPEPTSTPTITPTATATPIPSPTASRELCLGMTRSGSRYIVYQSANRTSTQLGTAPPEQPVRILDQTRDKDGRLWYRVDYGDAETTHIGWIPAEFVIEVTDCPRLP